MGQPIFGHLSVWFHDGRILTEPPGGWGRMNQAFPPVFAMPAGAGPGLESLAIELSEGYPEALVSGYRYRVRGYHPRFRVPLADVDRAVVRG